MSMTESALQMPLIDGIKFFLNADPRILFSNDAEFAPRLVNRKLVVRPLILEDMKYPTTMNGGIALIARTRMFAAGSTSFDIAMEISGWHYYAVAFYKHEVMEDGKIKLRLAGITPEEEFTRRG